MKLRDAMQRIALEFPSYGWPRMTEELKRRGWAVNHKRVYRLMREDNLLCLRRRKFVVTTDSAHTLPVYPNLARAMTPSGLISSGWPILPNSVAGRVRLSGGDSGCVFAASDWLGAGPHAGRHTDVAGVAPGAGAAAAVAGAGASLRPRRAVCFARVHGFAAGARHHDQHVAQRQSVRQRHGRVVHENAEVRGSLSRRLSRSARSPRFDRAFPGTGVQRKAAAFGARVSSARRVRGYAVRQKSKRSGLPNVAAIAGVRYEFFEA